MNSSHTIQNWLVLFDSENQATETQSLKEWSTCNLFLFPFNIKENQSMDILKEISKHNIQGIIFVIGPSTNYLHSIFLEDSKKVISLTLPIICFNINQNLGLDEISCPRFLWSVGAIHMPLTAEDVTFTLCNIKADARIHESTGSFFFRRNYPYDDPLRY